MKRDVLPNLLAKWRIPLREVDPRSWPLPRGLHLEEHLRETLAASSWLLDDSTFGRRLWTVMGLQSKVSYEDFAKLCRLSVLLHDIGKANQEFQEMLRKLEAWFRTQIEEAHKRRLSDEEWKDLGSLLYDTLNDPDYSENLRYRQKFRHEIAGVLWFIEDERRTEWLIEAAGSKDNAYLVLAAIFGHHRKTHRQFDQEHYSEAVLKFPKGEIEETLNYLISEYRLGFSPVPREDVQPVLFHAARESFKVRLHPEEFNRIPETNLSKAIKFVTILSDIYGSMTPKAGYPGGLGKYAADLKEAILMVLTPKEFPLTEKQIPAHIRGNLREFQKEALKIVEDALFIIGCGGGKTTAGFLWAADSDLVCRTNVIFTGMMTSAVAQIYLDTGEEEKSTLRSSRADIDLELLREMEQLKADWDAKKTPAEREKEALLENSVLGATEWEEDEDDPVQDLQSAFTRMLCPMTFATVDQLLGVITNRHSAILWLPYIVNAKVVFDEFDQFDRRMLGAFEKFLEWFPGLLVCGMSATVPKDLEEMLKKYRQGLRVIQSTGANDPSFAPRYRFHRITREQADALFTLEERTLWIVNRVKVCQAIGVDHPDALVYHAKFPYAKKMLRQAQVVSAFRSMKPVKAICTQIVGSSFNIYGDRLITEIAPPGDMIQRPGRVSPRGEIPKKITDIYFYPPDSHLPYPAEEFGDYDEWCNSLLGKVWSYKELVDHYRDNWVGKKMIPIERDIFDTQVFRLREASNKSALLGCDLPAIREALKAAKSPKERAGIIQRYEFSIFPRKGKQTEFYHRIVIKGTFDERLGIVEEKED